MKAAGLTHGGFYKHFASRDELVAEAVDRALTDGEEAIRSLTDGADDPLAAFVDWYASAEHRDNPAGGCAVVALGSDVPRAEDRVRTAYREQVERYLALLERLHGGGEEPAAKRSPRSRHSWAASWSRARSATPRCRTRSSGPSAKPSSASDLIRKFAGSGRPCSRDVA